jgi:uncharacterized protein with HEPN domain
MDDASVFVKNMDYDIFVKDTKTTYAVIRALEIIGEATKKCLFLSKLIIPRYLGRKWQE